MTQILIFVTSILVLPCSGNRWQQHLNHARRSFFKYDPREVSHIIGVPEFPSHLPEAEPILPGHTLIRPAFGMLKSAIKFPHLDLEDGSGVYGNFDNFGLTYDGTNERVLYTGFRRSPADYLMVVPEKNKREPSKPRFKIIPTVVDLKRRNSIDNLLNRLRRLNLPGNTKILVLSNSDSKSPHETSNSHYLSQINPVDREDKITFRYRPVKPIRDPNLKHKTRDPILKFPNSRTFDQGRNIIQDRDEHLQLRYEEKSSNDEGKMEQDTTKQKLISLGSIKGPYSHIKFRGDALDYSPFLIPRNIRKIKRHGSFFNQGFMGGGDRLPSGLHDRAASLVLTS